MQNTEKLVKILLSIKDSIKFNFTFANALKKKRKYNISPES